MAALLAAPALTLLLVGWYHGSARFPEPPFEGFVTLLAVLAALSGVIALALAAEVLRLRSVTTRALDRAAASAGASIAEAGAVERIRRLQREVDTLCAIRNLSIIANDDVDLRRVLQSALAVVEQTLDATEVHVYLRGGGEEAPGAPVADSPDVTRRRGQTQFSETGEPVKKSRRVSASLGKLAARAIAEQKSVFRNDKNNVNVASVLTADGETLGVLVVRVPRREDPAAVTSVLEALAKPIALAIRKPALYERAVFDALTRLYTKRHFTEQLARHFGQSRRLGTPLALIMVDIDHFKSVNDTHGHLSGDAVLAQVARAIRETVREYDTAYRYGGEEMAVISPDVNGEQAARLAERLRLAVEELRVKVANELSVSPTVSVGVACWRADHRAPQDLIAEADAALYAAKQGGRNRVCVAAPAGSAAAPAPAPAPAATT